MNDLEDELSQQVEDISIILNAATNPNISFDEEKNELSELNDRKRSINLNEEGVTPEQDALSMKKVVVTPKEETLEDDLKIASEMEQHMTIPHTRMSNTRP